MTDQIKQTEIDFRNIVNRTTVTVTLENGERFTGILIDKDHDYADEYASGYVKFAFEGDWWDRINDRFDSEVLELRQRLERKTREATEITLEGPVRDNNIFVYQPVGKVSEVEVFDQ